MKNLVLIALVFLLQIRGVAQNLIPNGSFEGYTTCPTGYAQVNNVLSWRAYNSSPDYLNACFPGTSGPDVPTNAFGWQHAADGNAYVGFVAYAGTTSTFREYVATTFSPMTIGLTYKISMSVSLGNVSKWGTDNLGVWFYDNGPATVTGSTLLSNTPQVNFAAAGAITDTQNWVRVTAFFTPDSSYDNLVIGGFYPISSTTATQISTAGSYAYYFIDSVVVELSSGINNLYTDSMICAGDTFVVPYTLNNSALFTSTNVFSVQLSNSSGSF
ncbi:MAG: hypothetical protein JNK00_04425, partial [Flavipsychrobacter sp.]|nr:hypothetical protein [Flavipsychrobacter sp.]